MGTAHPTEIKILGLESLYKRRLNPITKEEVVTHSGVDFARIVQPLNHLGRVPGFKTDVIWDFPLDIKKISWWDSTIQKYDVLFCSYIDNSLLYAAIKMLCDKHHVNFVVDLDDNIWSVSPNHPHYQDYKVEYDPMGHPRYSDNLFKRTVIIGDADFVTTTCPFLRYKIVEYAKRSHETIEILPNYIDLSLYDYRKVKPKESKELVIGYHGGASHFDDLNKPDFLKAMSMILEKYPQTVFRTTGFFFPQLKELWGRQYQFMLARGDVYKWINNLWPVSIGESDFVVAPLDNNNYSRGKSYIKYLEYSAGKKAGIYEAFDPYQTVIRDGDNGYLAHGWEEWYLKMSTLIEAPVKRRRMGEKAFEDIQNYKIEDGVKKYADFFRMVVDTKK